MQYCHVGRLSNEVGWKYQDVVRTLENKRRVKTILNIKKRNNLKVCLYIYQLSSTINILLHETLWFLSHILNVYNYLECSYVDNKFKLFMVKYNELYWSSTEFHL